MNAPALRATGLRVSTAAGELLVDGVDLDLHAGRTTALVGPSGAGKSLTLRALAALLPPGLRASGQVQLGNVDLLTTPARRLRRVRGRSLGWIGQDATASLNPTVPVSRHFHETLRAHENDSRARSSERDQGLAALAGVGLETPHHIWDAYPFELSGGQAQRVAIALATLWQPTVLLADEITAELDPVSQTEVLQLLSNHAASGAAVLLITHDLAAAARWADEIVTIEAGTVLESGPSQEILHTPTTELTRSWSRALSTPDRPAQKTTPHSAGPIVLECTNVGMTLHGRGRHTLALEGVDLHVRQGETVAVVGRSGSGKSTLVGVLAALDHPDTGELKIHGQDVWNQPAAQIRDIRRTVGLLFQDALTSFDPRYTVRQVVAEGRRPDNRTTEAELLTKVGLDPNLLDRYPITLSGGQRQRVALARALAPEPTILLADEPTSGLDVLAQNQLIQLLDQAAAEQGMAVVLVTHDLRVARQVSNRFLVLDQGQIRDQLDTADLDRTTHPATRALLQASQAGEHSAEVGTVPSHPVRG